MIIIFEGSDYSGKTTLAERLLKQTNWPIFFKPDTKKYFPNDWDRYQNFYTLLSYHFFLQWPKNSNLIVDRLWLSAIIYSKAFERKDDLSYISPTKCHENGFKNIFLEISDFDTITERIKNRVDDKRIINRIYKIWTLYQEFFNANKDMPGSLFLNGEDPIEKNFEKILVWLGGLNYEKDL
jgi:thymidylate kinase